MKKIFLTAALLLSIGLPSIRLQAQQVVIDEPNSILFISGDKAQGEIISIMKSQEQLRFHDPKAPRFLLTDQKGKFALGIGGYVRTTAEYDFNGMVRNIDFYPAFISHGNSLDFARHQFQMDATTSALFFKLVGHTRRLGDFVVYTGGNFRGNGRAFKLHNAYIQFLGCTIGYHYGSFMDLSALPPAIDFAGPNGSVCYRTTQLSYACHPWKAWKFGAAIEMPSVSAENTQQNSISTQRMPNWALNAQYNWNENGHIKIAGILRSMTYSSFMHQRAYATTGFGVQGSTVCNLTPKWKIYGQFTYGKGIGSFLNDLSNLQVDLVADPENEGKMMALPMMGWFASLQYNFTPNLFVSSTYSLSRLYSEHQYDTFHPEQYRKGQYLSANAFWNVSNNLQVGLEYLRGWRTDFRFHTRHANRLNLLAQYSF